MRIFICLKSTSHFSPFNCCLSVVLLLGTGDYPENSHAVFCPNKQRSFEPLCVWIWVTENSELPSSLFSLWLLCLLSWFEKNISAWDISVFYFCCCCFMLVVVLFCSFVRLFVCQNIFDTNLIFKSIFWWLFVKMYLVSLWTGFLDACCASRQSNVHSWL